MPKKARAASQILDRIFDHDRAYKRAVQEARVELSVAQQIYDARIKAGLTQADLAKGAGTHQSAIARMESAGYDSHSLPTLRKIADALGLVLTVEFKPLALADVTAKARTNPASDRRAGRSSGRHPNGETATPRSGKTSKGSEQAI